MGRSLWLHGVDGVSAFAKGDKVTFLEQGEGKELAKVEPQVNASERKLSIKTDPEEFKKFHALLTRDRPDFQPFYFPLNPNSKDPLDNKSWKANRITVEQAVKYLEMGFNIGIAATDTDILVLMDADDLEKVGAFKPTLTVISRKRIGKHGFYFTKDKPAETIFDDSAKQNIATEDAGEIRAKWQYVVCAGSYVPVSKEELERIPETDRANAGRYTLCNELPVNEITFNELPEVYRNCLLEKRQAEISAKIKKESSATNRPPEFGKYRSKLWDLTLEDVTGKNAYVQGRFPSLFHGSETGKNNSISNGLLHCWRHNVSHTPLTALAVLSGISDCSHAGYGHNGSGTSKLDFRDGKTVFDLWLYAKCKLKKIPEDDPIPSSALVHYGILNGTITKVDVIDGWKLPTASYNKVIQTLKKNGIDPGREEIIEVIPKRKKSKKSKDDDEEEKKSIGEISAEILKIYPVITLRDNVREMYFYENGVYKYGAEPVIKATAQKIIGPGSTNNKVKNVVYYIQNLTFIDRSRINKEKHLINLKNGFYNINANTLEPHTPGILSTCQIPIKYDPAAKCPNISRFMCEILRPADIALILQLMGYCLISDYTIQKAFMWHGSGLNGKGTLARLFSAYLGKDNVSNESLQALNLDKFSAANLYGKLVNLDSDLSNASVNEDAMFKRLTGGDMIPAERKFQDRFRFQNEARLIFGANELPKHSKGGFAWNRRWIIIDFPVTFNGAQEDKNLDCKLQTDEELSGLLNFTLTALKWLLETKTFFYSKTPEEVGEEYLLKSDSVMAFMQECTSPADEMVTKTDLYKAYVEWGKVRNIKKIEPVNRFGVLMKRGGYMDTRPRTDGEYVRCYEGFVLDLFKIEELTKENKSQNDPGKCQNEERTRITEQTCLNQVAAPHWYTTIMKSDPGDPGYSPDKLIKVVLLLGKDKKLGIGDYKDLRTILDYLDHPDQSVEYSHEKDDADNENQLSHDTNTTRIRTRIKTQENNISVTELSKIGKNPEKSDAKKDAFFDQKTAKKTNENVVPIETTTKPVVEKEKRKNVAEDNKVKRVEKNLCHPDHIDQPIRNAHQKEAKDSEIHLIQDVLEKAQIWQGMKGQINSANLGAFSMWYCDQSGNVHGPTRIKEIASKIFGITPEPPKNGDLPEPCDIFTEQEGWVVTQRAAIKVSGEENQIELGDFEDKEEV
ncbi:hypothetical protein METP3_03616 [Methanosarcinales archaeon]|nr:hypothetical protein METP3_03616 [Methanosarcinales archaeon]